MPNFQPNVSYNVPVVQPVQWKEVERPDINVQPIHLDRFFSNLAISAAQSEEAEIKKEYNEGLNRYALEVSKIVEGHRQGRYKEHEADRRIASLTDSYIGNGWGVLDITKVRDKMAGKIPELEQRRQTMMMEHAQEFEENRIDALRKEPQFANISDDEARNIISTLDGFDKTVTYFSDLYRSGKTDEEVKMYAESLIDSGTDLAAYNVLLDLKGMATSEEGLAQLNQQQVDAMRHNLEIGLRDKYKVSQGIAKEMVKRAFNAYGVSQVLEDSKETYRNNTEWNKMAIENIDTSAQYSLSQIPEYTFYKNLTPEMQEAINMQNPTFFKDLFDKVKKNISEPQYAAASIKTLGANTPRDASWTIQSYTSLVSDRLMPTSYLAGLAIEGTKIGVENLKNPFEATSTENAKINLANARRIVEAFKDKDIDTMRREAAKRGDVKTIEGLDIAESNLGFAKATVKAYDLTKAKPELNNLVASLQNQGVSRFRIDPESGKLLMTRKATGGMQTLGDLFASAETRRQVNEVNDLLESSTPAERKAFVTMMFNDDIAPYNGEELWDTSKRTVKEMIADVANDTAKALWSLSTFYNDPEAVKVVESNDEKAFGLLAPRMQLGEVGQGMRDTFLNLMNGKKEQPLEPIFTGEETKESSKVSNKTTLSNAWTSAKPAVENYESMIQSSASRYNVDPEYLDLIAAIETRRGNDARTSSAGAQGIMQFMPKTWREEVMPNFEGFTEADIRDPQKSIEAAAWYLDRCKQFAQTIKPDADPQESAEIQAACYNAGMGRIKKAIDSADGSWEKAKKSLPEETKKYVGYIKKHYKAEDEFAEDMEAEDLNANILIGQLWDYIDYDRLPPELKRKVDERKK